MTINQRYIFAALVVYTSVIFISQAAMSIGAALCGLLILLSFKPLKKSWSSLKEIIRKNSVLKNYLKLTFLFMLACALSLVVAYFFPVNIGGMSPEVTRRDFSKIWYFFWPLLLVLGWDQTTLKQKKILLSLFAFGAVFCGILGISQFFTGWVRPQRIPNHVDAIFYHANGFFGFHLSYASIVIFPVLFCFHEMFKPKWISRTLAVHGFIWGSTGLILTFSRTLWLALPLTLLIYVFTQFSKKASAISILLFGILCAIAWQSPIIKYRVMNSFLHNERYMVWEANFALIKKNPITGVGWHKNASLIAGYYKEKFPDNYRNLFTDHAHNNIIHFMAGTGLLGLSFFLLWNIFIFFTAHKAHTGLFFAWVVFQLNGLTQSNFLEGKCLHMMMWVVALQLSLLLHGAKSSIHKES